MDFQTADYEQLCGCVTVLYTDAEVRQLNGARTDYKREFAEARLRAGVGRRIVMVNCERCHGTGLTLNAEVTSAGTASG